MTWELYNAKRLNLYLVKRLSIRVNLRDIDRSKGTRFNLCLHLPTFCCVSVNNRSNIWRSRCYYRCYAENNYLFWLAKFIHLNYHLRCEIEVEVDELNNSWRNYQIKKFELTTEIILIYFPFINCKIDRTEIDTLAYCCQYWYFIRLNVFCWQPASLWFNSHFPDYLYSSDALFLLSKKEEKIGIWQ